MATPEKIRQLSQQGLSQREISRAPAFLVTRSGSGRSASRCGGCWDLWRATITAALTVRIGSCGRLETGTVMGKRFTACRTWRDEFNIDVDRLTAD